jgi:SOS-response transcriptional repressor LexA
MDAGVTDTTKEANAAWIKAVQEDTGLSIAALAKKAGIERSTLTRALSPSQKHTLSKRTIDKICEATGLPGPGAAPSRTAGFREAELEPYDGPGENGGASHNHYRFTVKTRALELSGILPGDVLTVDMNADPIEGDIVVAQVYDWQRGTAETVLRLHEPPFLITHTIETGRRKPQLVNGQDVAIKGVVIALERGRQGRRRSG